MKNHELVTELLKLPNGDGIKRCKSKSILLFNQNSVSQNLSEII